MSARGGKTRFLRRPHPVKIRETTDDDTQSQDLPTTFDPQSGSRPVLPHVPGFTEFETPVSAAIARGKTFHRDTTRADSAVGNPYGPPVEYLQRTTVDDDAHIERQVSPSGTDDVDQGDDPHDIPQPESDDITQPPSEEVPQPEAPAFPELREHKVWTIDTNENIEVLNVKDPHKLYSIPEGKRVIVEFNGMWQPVGRSGVKWRWMTGKMIRRGTFIRISDYWKKKYFYIVPGSDIAKIKKDLWRDMGEKLKYWRAELKKPLAIGADDTPDSVKARAPTILESYEQEDVDILLQKWCEKKNQEFAAYMKQIRALYTTPHCAGSKSYAQHSHETVMMTGEAPTRAKNYIKTHTKKGGGFPNDLVAERVAEMTRLEESDTAALVDGPDGTIRWAPDDAYAQAHGNKPEYAGRVRGVSKNILPVRGHIHSYYTPRPNATPPPAVVSEMIQSAIELKEQQLREEMNQQMDAMTQQFTKRMEEALAHQAAQYEERFRSLEGHRVGMSEPEATTGSASQDVGSPARISHRSSGDRTQDKDQNETRNVSSTTKKSRLSKVTK